MAATTYGPIQHHAKSVATSITALSNPQIATIIAVVCSAEYLLAIWYSPPFVFCTDLYLLVCVQCDLGVIINNIASVSVMTKAHETRLGPFHMSFTVRLTVEGETARILAIVATPSP